MPAPEEEKAALQAYKALVLRIGQGFHPDTPFDGYEPPIDFMTEDEFETIILNAFEVCDPYEVGLELFELMEDTK
jgi:hypothetical protein